MIENHLDKPWNWGYLSCNPNITMYIIEKYPDKPWNWGWISNNPNITMDIIEKYSDKPWDWKWMSENKFLYNKIVYDRELNKDIHVRKNNINGIMSQYIYRDLNSVIIDYIYYD